MDNEQIMMIAGVALLILALWYFSQAQVAEGYSPNGYSSAFASYL